jgi:hypothetical protein
MSREFGTFWGRAGLWVGADGAGGASTYVVLRTYRYVRSFTYVVLRTYLYGRGFTYVVLRT